MSPNTQATLRQPHEYLRRITSHAGFFHELGQPSEFNALDPEQKHVRRTRGIARAALSLSEHSHSEQPDIAAETDKYVFKLISSLDSFYQAQKKLDSIAEHDRRHPHNRTAHADKAPYIETAAAFNHAMREVIDRMPSLGFDELLGFTTSMFAAGKGRHAVHDFEYMARAVINGMRHEIAAEQIIGIIPQAEIEYIDPNEHLSEAQAEHESILSDMNGRDIRVRIGGRSVNIDIKASEKTAEKAKAHSRHPERIIWSGITNEEFGNDLRISPDLARQKAGSMTRALLRAAFPEKYAAIA